MKRDGLEVTTPKVWFCWAIRVIEKLNVDDDNIINMRGLNTPAV